MRPPLRIAARQASDLDESRLYPRTVKDENDAYEVLVCTHLGLKPRCQKPLTEEETRAAQQAARAAQEAAQMRAAKEEARRRAEEEEAKAAKGKGSKKAAKAPEPEPEPEAEPEEEIEPEAEPEPIGPPLVTSAGTEFPTMKDLYDDIHAFQVRNAARPASRASAHVSPIALCRPGQPVARRPGQRAAGTAGDDAGGGFRAGSHGAGR